MSHSMHLCKRFRQDAPTQHIKLTHLWGDPSRPRWPGRPPPRKARSLARLRQRRRSALLLRRPSMWTTRSCPTARRLCERHWLSAHTVRAACHALQQANLGHRYLWGTATPPLGPRGGLAHVRSLTDAQAGEPLRVHRTNALGRRARGPAWPPEVPDDAPLPADCCAGDALEVLEFLEARPARAAHVHGRLAPTAVLWLSSRLPQCRMPLCAKATCAGL